MKRAEGVRAVTFNLSGTAGEEVSRLKKQQEQLAPVGLIETAFLFLPHNRTTTEKSTKGYTINHEKELQNRNKMCAGRLYPRKR